MIAEIGAWKAGATVLPPQSLYTPGELRDPLNAAGVEIVVTLTPFYKRLKDISPRRTVKRIIVTSIKEYLPPLLRLLFTIFKERKRPSLRIVSETSGSRIACSRQRLR
jgi:long-chain acyl-CoA synthetase